MTALTWRLATILTTGLMSALILAAPHRALAQTNSGTLTGAVSDAQGGVLPGAILAAVYEPTGALTQAVTGADGTYTIAGLRPGGPYTVTATMPGFRTMSRADVAVTAGDARRLDFTMQIAAMSEELTVRAGTELAQNEKRSASNIIDVVSADAVGRFPDANAAEALRRIPGVSLEIDQGEGRFVVVRGIDPTLNNVTINGQIVGTPAEFGTRGVSMDSVPADLVSRLEVTKAVTPDMDANAIGASVNIATLGAFDRPEGLLSATVRTGYNNLSGRSPFSGNATWGRILDAERRWGLMLGGSFSQRRFDSELFRVADSWGNFNGSLVPQNQAFFLYDVDRRRQGLNAALTYRPVAAHDVTVRFNHNLFRDIEGRQQVEFDLTRGTLSNQTPTSGRFSGGRASREYRDYEQEHTINAFMATGDHLVGGSFLDWRAGFSRGQRDTPNRVDWEFRSGGNAFPNTYDTSDPTAPIITPNAAFYDATAYPFRRVRFRTDLEREDVLTAEASLRRDVSTADRRAFWKAGAKVVTRAKSQDRENMNYTGSGFSLADFGLGASGPDDFFGGRARFGPTLNLPGLQRFFADNPQFFTFDALGSLNNSLAQDFEADETVTAGYLMGQIDFDGWNLLAGIRVEHTSGTYDANELLYDDGDFTGNIRPSSGDTSYTDVLPGVHVNFFPRQNLTIRAAWTNTIGRPSYADLAPIAELDDILNDDGSYTGGFSSGNPDLKPYESTNLDLSIEYYLDSGLIAVAPFYKRIDNPIYGLNFAENDFTYNGRFYDRLGFSQPANADSGRIAGVEFTYQNYFSGLPAPFDGLGVNMNYTVTSSRVDVFERDDELPFFKQSDHVGNVAVLYEKRGVAAQVSMSFNSPALGSIGGDAMEDNYADWYRVLDMKLSAPLARGLRGLLEISNLNDEHRLRYAGTSEYRTADERYSWSLLAGIDWRFR